MRASAGGGAGGEEKWKALSCVQLFVALESPGTNTGMGKFFTNWATREAYGGGESMFLLYSATHFLRPHGFKWEDLCETSIIINLL